jgi:hypothetical protein
MFTSMRVRVLLIVLSRYEARRILESLNAGSVIAIPRFCGLSCVDREALQLADPRPKNSTKFCQTDS